jgi:hypothetical protein
LRRFLYPSAKKFFYWLLTRSWGTPDAEAQPDELSAPAANGVEVHRPPTERPGFRRGLESINWMLKYPWLTENPEEDTPGYFFPVYCPLFRYLVVRLRPRDCSEVRGFAVLSVSRRNDLTVLKVLDYQVDDPKYLAHLSSLALRYAAQYQADRIIMPEECAPALRRLWLARPLLRKRQRRYFGAFCRTHKALESLLGQMELHYADGDCPFT